MKNKLLLLLALFVTIMTIACGGPANHSPVIRIDLLPDQPFEVLRFHATVSDPDEGDLPFVCSDPLRASLTMPCQDADGHSLTLTWDAFQAPCSNPFVGVTTNGDFYAMAWCYGTFTMTGSVQDSRGAVTTTSLVIDYEG